MINIDTSDRTEQRKFGAVMAAAIAILAGIRWGHAWWRSGEMPGAPYILLGIAAAFLVLGLAAPKLLQPVFVAWIKFAIALNWLITHLVLTLSFVFLIIPFGLAMQWFGEDPLKRKWEPQRESYWEDAEEQPVKRARYRRQY